jgi:hypothetical protein
MKKNLIVLGATALGALIIGIGIGGAGTASTGGVTVTEEAKPAVTIESEAVTTVPAACLDAFDDVDTILGAVGVVTEIAGDAMLLIPEAATAGMEYDADALDAMADQMEGWTGDINAQTNIVTPARASYDANVALCRAG